MRVGEENLLHVVAHKGDGRHLRAFRIDRVVRQHSGGFFSVHHARVVQPDHVLIRGLKGILDIRQGNFVSTVRREFIAVGRPFLHAAERLHRLPVDRQVEQVAAGFGRRLVVEREHIARLRFHRSQHGSGRSILSRVRAGQHRAVILYRNRHRPGVFIRRIGEGQRRRRAFHIQRAVQFRFIRRRNRGLFARQERQHIRLRVLIAEEETEQADKRVRRGLRTRCEESHIAEAVNHNRGRDAIEPETRKEVERFMPDRERQAMRRHIFRQLRIVIVFIDAQRKDFHLVLVLLIGFLQEGELRFTRAAPRCPEVNQHHFLLLQGFGEGMGNAVNVRKGKIGHGRAKRVHQGSFFRQCSAAEAHRQCQNQCQHLLHEDCSFHVLRLPPQSYKNYKARNA